MSTHLFQANNISCWRQFKSIFTNLSFVVKTGELLLVEGPNGSGKSSLLRLLSGIATPSEGDVLWAGSSIYSSRIEYGSQLHYLAHTNGLKLNLTVLENVSLTNHFLATAPVDPEAALTLLKLNDYRDTLIHHLSAGQKRRVALAKLILFPKPLWLLDEPLTALDKETQAIFLRLMHTHLKTGGLAIITSHHPIDLKDSRIITLRLKGC